MSRSIPPFLTVGILLACVNSSARAEQNIDNWIELVYDWSGVIKCLLGIFFVYAGVSLLLYNHLATHKIWKKYTNENSSTKVIGDVLFSELSSSSSSSATTTILQHNNDNDKYYDVSVLYTTTIHKYENDSHNKFRYPNAIERKRYLRKFTGINEPIPRGTRIDVYILRGMPRSGCIRVVIDANIRNHSHCRTCLILVPGVCLVGIFAYRTMVELYGMGGGDDGDDDQKETILQWTVVCVVLLVILSCTNMWCQRRFQRELDMVFQGGIPQRTIVPSSSSRSRQGRVDDDSYNNSQSQLIGSTNTRNNDRSQPLLPPSTNSSLVSSSGRGRGRTTSGSVSGPLHQKGMNVFYQSSGSTVTPAHILDVHLDDELKPYYTIRLEDGREKQTDNDHILLLV